MRIDARWRYRRIRRRLSGSRRLASRSRRRGSRASSSVRAAAAPARPRSRCPDACPGGCRPRGGRAVADLDGSGRRPVRHGGVERRSISVTAMRPSPESRCHEPPCDLGPAHLVDGGEEYPVRDHRFEHRVKVLRNDLGAVRQPRRDARRPQQHAQPRGLAPACTRRAMSTPSISMPSSTGFRVAVQRSST